MTIVSMTPGKHCVGGPPARELATDARACMAWMVRDTQRDKNDVGETTVTWAYRE